VYVGCARGLQDIENALLLATRCFRGEKQESTTDIKRLLMSPHTILSERDIVVLINEQQEICGACFLIDRTFYRGKNRLQATFLTSICIAEHLRGKGLSTLLMNAAIEECGRRHSVFAIVIARRTVDYFYNKFFFWGVSQYASIHLKLKDTSANHYKSVVATESDLFEINQLFEATYAKLYGACIRTAPYWKHVLWKAEQQKHQFIVYKKPNKIQGYVICSGHHIHEFATAENTLNLELLNQFAQDHAFKELTLSCPKEHSLVGELHTLDFTMTQRQCNYGGHMVRILDQDRLIKCLTDDVEDRIRPLGIEHYSEQYGENFIEVRKGQVRLKITGSPYHYENTCFLMGIDYLSTILSKPIVYRPQAFNIPLMDQA
jgi:predicted acetyltransferase